MSGATDTKDLIDGVRSGDTRALARAITLVEDGDPASYELVEALYPHTGHAHAVGFTGPPGVGKSSLVSALVARVRAAGQTVGVVSVDPSSPFTQGALLGDRIRLVDHFLDPGVFIRSMGTRGHAGGLAEATLQALLVLDAAGKDVVFLETVGTGQSDIGVLSIADTVVLVLQPGSGDSVQALKAGIMEIPDVIADQQVRPPAGTRNRDRRPAGAGPRAPRAREAADRAHRGARGNGLDELWAAIEATRRRARGSRSAARAQPRGRGLRGRLGAGAPPSGGRPSPRPGAPPAARRRFSAASSTR